MARKPSVTKVDGPKVWYPGLVDKTIDLKTEKQVEDENGGPVYIHKPWPKGDYVHLKPRKNGFIASQAQFAAQVIPAWATPDTIKHMSNEEFGKISWRSDLFNATTILEMLDPEDPWVLHDADTGALIPEPMVVEGVIEVFEEWEVSFLLDEINKLALGPKAEPGKVDELTGATFSVLGPDGSPGDGEESGHGRGRSKALVG
jgi:hypothetical protein